MSNPAAAVDPDQWVPSERQSFPLHELAKLFLCSVQHLWNLIEAKAIIVPQENIDRAKSRASIQIPRASVVDFVGRRSSRKFMLRGLKMQQKKSGKHQSSKRKVNANS